MSSNTPQSDRPNVVLIVFDYMGYADLEPFGKGEIKTPNIRRLAERGRRYTDCYAAAPICTPSRAALMTGRYPRRLGMEQNLKRDQLEGEGGLSLSEKTIARYLRDVGYATGLFGKWHIGYRKYQNPDAHGFDEFFGFHEWNIDYYSHKTINGQTGLYLNETPVEREGYTTDLFTGEALDFIDRHAAEPFFAYVAYNSMLPPFRPPGQEKHTENFDQWERPGNRADYVAAVERLDHSVGQILDALDRHEISEETMVLLTIDHGGGELASNSEFFHGFGTLWEGGIRVPLVMTWPHRVKAGDICHSPTMLTDILPTILGVAGISRDREYDGIDLLDPDFPGTAPRTLFWRTDLALAHSDTGRRSQRAVRQGDWKYLFDGLEFLCNLDEDPGERNNLAGQNPALLKELRELSLGSWHIR